MKTQPKQHENELEMRVDLHDLKRKHGLNITIDILREGHEELVITFDGSYDQKLADGLSALMDNLTDYSALEASAMLDAVDTVHTRIMITRVLSDLCYVKHPF